LESKNFIGYFYIAPTENATGCDLIMQRWDVSQHDSIPEWRRDCAALMGACRKLWEMLEDSYLSLLFILSAQEWGEPEGAISTSGF